MPQRSLKKIMILVFILLLAIIGALAVLKLNKKPPIQQTQNKEQGKQEEQSRIDLQKLAQEYQHQLRQIIQDYVSLDASIGAEDYDLKLKNTGATIDKLLDLTLTGEFKELHLSLVVALDNLRQAYENGDRKAVREAEDGLKSVLVENKLLN